MLINYMEVIIKEKLPSVLEKEELDCTCEKCIEDVMALTLNNLPPKYVATEKGIVYEKINQFDIQFNADIVRELTNAIKKVKENPRH